MTDHNTRVPEGMKMPRPWFRANNTAGPLFGLYKGGNGFGRDGPLAEGERLLGEFILPDFQRPPVWFLDQKVRLIESLWSGLPIGAYVVNRVLGSPYDNYLLDGQQRISAILEYVADAFPVMGYKFSEITLGDRRQFQMIPVSCLETSLTDLEQIKDVYDRLAYGGTAHEPKAA